MSRQHTSQDTEDKAAIRLVPQPITARSPMDAASGPDRIEQSVSSTGGMERREQVVTDASGSEHREQVVHDNAGEQRFRLQTVTRATWLIVGMIESLIGLRVILKLIAANPDNAFASFVYSASGLFVAPFVGLTGTPEAQGMVLEISTIIGMLIYAGLGWGIVHIAQLFMDRPTTRSTSTYDRSRG